MIGATSVPRVSIEGSPRRAWHWRTEQLLLPQERDAATASMLRDNLCQLGGLLGPSPVALPFGRQRQPGHHVCAGRDHALNGDFVSLDRSEEHTSELQSLRHLVCRLLLEKKKKCLTTK